MVYSRWTNDAKGLFFPTQCLTNFRNRQVAGKRPKTGKIQPNIKRQLILVALAMVGIGVGYGLGFVFKKPAPAPVVDQSPAKTTPSTISSDHQNQELASPPLTTQAPTPVLPEHNGASETASDTRKIRAYEEALPGDIVETTIPPIIPLEPISPPIPLTPVAENKPGIAIPEMAGTKSLKDAEIASAPTDQAPDMAPETIPETDPLPIIPPIKAAIRTWQINALPFVSDDRPKIAIVIDDMGIDRTRSRRAVDLPPPLTLSYLTYGRDLATQTANARAGGHELLMHIPMEPSSAAVDPGPNVLLNGMEETELLKNLRWNLDQFDGYVGINNHMGSRFTSDLDGMRSVMKELASRGLLFLDSVTSPRTKGSRAAKSAGIPHLVRNIFLDHVDDLQSIKDRLRDTERLARKQGHAIAIGHPRDKTLEALAPWLQTIEDRGFQLIPLTALLIKKNPSDSPD
jgi:uncharacterized protein